jgi:hypothetical protein
LVRNLQTHTAGVSAGKSAPTVSGRP